MRAFTVAVLLAFSLDVAADEAADARIAELQAQVNSLAQQVRTLEQQVRVLSDAVRRSAEQRPQTTASPSYVMPVETPGEFCVRQQTLDHATGGPLPSYSRCD